MRPRIFIGSSKEGLNIAEQIKAYFSKDFDCYLWSDDIFKYNDNYLETLMKEASLFDFGFMVCTNDDWTKSRDVEQGSPRDNVIFEYILFRYFFSGIVFAHVKIVFRNYSFIRFCL